MLSPACLRATARHPLTPALPTLPACLQAPAALPELPPNARYMHTQACTTGVWGILAGGCTRACVSTCVHASTCDARHGLLAG